MRPYSPGGVLIAFTPAREESIPPTPSTHRLQPGLPGYLIPFATPAFEPQRQTQSGKPPSPLVFLPISTHFTATPGIPLASPALKNSSFLPITDITSELLSKTCHPACAPFTPNNSGQRLPPTYYRGCWHVVSRGLFPVYRQLFLKLIRRREKSFTSRSPSSLTRRRSIRVSPIVEYSPLLPPVGVWTVSQFHCGRSSSQTGYRSSAW